MENIIPTKSIKEKLLEINNNAENIFNEKINGLESVLKDPIIIPEAQNGMNLTAIFSAKSYKTKHTSGIYGFEYRDKPKKEVEEALNKANIEYDFFKEDIKKSTEKKYIYAYEYFEDTNYFDKEITDKILKDLDVVKEIKDKKIIYESLNKMERLNKQIEDMAKYKERYKVKTRDKPIINSLIRLINASNNEELNNTLLDELVGYTDDYTQIIQGYEKLVGYNNIINYRVKKLNSKPYEEIIFNKVGFNKDIYIDNKREYNKYYALISDIYKKNSNIDFISDFDYLIDSAGLNKKYKL